MNGRVFAAAGVVLMSLAAGLSPAWGQGQPQGAQRKHCTPMPLTEAPRPVEALPFEAIGPKHFDGVTPKATTVKPVSFKAVEAGGAFNEAAKGATLLAVTGRSDRAKLLVAVDGANLLVRRVVVYDSSGGVVRDDRNVRLRPGEGLALTRPKSGAAHDLRRTSSPTALGLEAVNGTKVAVLAPIIAIPTIARFMKSRDHNNDTEAVFSPAKIQQLLAPVDVANETWRQAGIVFWLTALERCTYALSDFPKAPSVSFERIPWPIEDCQRLFRQINRGYNRPQSTGLDLYVWFELGGGVLLPESNIVAYAAPHRNDGPSPGPGAIWLDPECLSNDCGRIVAHELGHFLSLRHSCDINQELAARKKCGLPVGDVPVCSAVAAANDNLMRGDFTKKGLVAKSLTPEQIRAARSIARGRAPH